MRSRRLIALLVVLAACSRGEPPQAAPSPTPSPSPQPVECPLTGEERPPDFPVDRPPVAVKIDNHRSARPQAGLEAADIVYEELAEGGITRFLAVYHCSDAEDLGPVRSARLIDPDILLEYVPVIFAYSGANPIVAREVASTQGVVDLRHGAHGALYSRRRGRPAPHNLFTSTEAIRSASEIQGPPQTGLVFSSEEEPAPPPPEPEESPNGEADPPPPPPGRSVSFSFAAGGSVAYTWDEAARAYLRFQGGDAHMGADERQLRATNVVIQKIVVSAGAAGSSSPQMHVVGEGEAVVLSRALATSGRWVRETRSERTRLLDAEGRPIRLAPGPTWIHLVPSTRPVEVG